MTFFKALKWCAATIIAIATLSTQSSAQFATSGPFLPTERNFSLMSRDVPAPSYRDPYCTKWTDSCSVCKRKTANDEAVCEAAEGSDAVCDESPCDAKPLY